ncbi:MAG: hypothetical protein EH225_08585 [Calditrichaeota bacterium]|nr:MAG: hypothetical protein EH225_08585 [Calditrichota bacterium]
MLAQSLEELYEEGRTSAKLETLINQIDTKFGICDADKDLIRSCAEVSIIEDALDIILFASSAEDVLKLFRKK